MKLVTTVDTSMVDCTYKNSSAVTAVYKIFMSYLYYI